MSDHDPIVGLRAHLLDKAEALRQRLLFAAPASSLDFEALQKVLLEPGVMRFPTVIRFSAQALGDGEFAHAHALGEKPSDGYCLFVHPHFETRTNDLPYLVLYHLPTINYGDVITHVEAELFGATALGLDIESYYQRLCSLADELPSTETVRDVTDDAE